MPPPGSVTASARVRRLALSCAALGLLGAGPAAAADDAPRLEVPPVVEVDPFKATQGLGTDGEPARIALKGVDTASAARYSFVIDASGVEDLITDSSFLPCDQDRDFVGACPGDDVHVGRFAGELSVTLNSRPSARSTAAGRSGTIEVTAKRDGKTVDTARITLRVTAPGPRFDRAITGITDARPGSTVALPSGFTNFSRRTYRSLVLGVSFSDGLVPVERFRNCRYEPVPAAASGTTPGHSPGMLCTVTGTVKPGGSYNLDLGAVRLGPQAAGDTVYYASEIHEPGKSDVPPVPGSRAGTGRTLTFTERPARDTTYVRDELLHLRTRIESTNKPDFSVNPVTLKGEVGDVVKAEFFFTNNGPGTASAVFDGESDNETANVVELTVPTGVTVVDAPETCHAQERKTRKDPVRYRCSQHRLQKSDLMTPGQFENFPFAFRLDEPSRGVRTDGWIRVATEFDLTKNDAHPEDNRAPVSVDIEGRAESGSFEGDMVAGPPVWGIGAVGAAAVGVLFGAAVLIRRRTTIRETEQNQ
ncbi:hypothetical protein ACFW9D_31570 [Streptomyces sp. NPDC059524]|uniref:hypothetical protein n=1 Tax=Streptomyces sp. NPDC059524 TaxID=3346856 RepID=UPI0036C94A91